MLITVLNSMLDIQYRRSEMVYVDQRISDLDDSRESESDRRGSPQREEQ